MVFERVVLPVAYVLNEQDIAICQIRLALVMQLNVYFDKVINRREIKRLMAQSIANYLRLAVADDDDANLSRSSGMRTFAQWSLRRDLPH